MTYIFIRVNCFFKSSGHKPLHLKLQNDSKNPAFHSKHTTIKLTTRTITLLQYLLQDIANTAVKKKQAYMFIIRGWRMDVCAGPAG